MKNIEILESFSIEELQDRNEFTASCQGSCDNSDSVQTVNDHIEQTQDSVNHIGQP